METENEENELEALDDETSNHDEDQGMKSVPTRDMRLIINESRAQKAEVPIGPSKPVKWDAEQVINIEMHVSSKRDELDAVQALNREMHVSSKRDELDAVQALNRGVRQDELPPSYDEAMSGDQKPKVARCAGEASAFSSYGEPSRTRRTIATACDPFQLNPESFTSSFPNQNVFLQGIWGLLEINRNETRQTIESVVSRSAQSLRMDIDSVRKLVQKNLQENEHEKRPTARNIDSSSQVVRAVTAGNSFGHGCKKCGCRSLCSCPCHRARSSAENQKDIREYIPRGSRQKQVLGIGTQSIYRTLAFDRASHRGQAFVKNLDASKLVGASGNLTSDLVHTGLSDENINYIHANTDRLTSGTCPIARPSDDLSSSHDYDKDDENDSMSGEQKRRVYRKRRTKCIIGCKTLTLSRKCRCPYHRRQQTLHDKSAETVDRKHIRKNGARSKHPKTRENLSDSKNYLKRVQGIGGESDDTDEVSENSSGNEICGGGHTRVSDGHSNDVNSNNNDAFTAVYQRDCGGAYASGGPPEDPSSGDDDSKDNDNQKDDDRGDRNRNTTRKSVWSIDSDAWEQCIKLLKEEDCKQEVESLLKKSKLPGRESLNETCKRFGRKSDVVRNICNAVCDYLIQKYESILDVWPGYRCDDKLVNTDVVFVVLTNDCQTIEGENYNLYCRGKYETKTEQENKEIAKREGKELPKTEELQKLKKVQRKCAPYLMDKHKRLVRVTISWVKHTAGETSPAAFKEQLCIALYVQIRGLVPLDEEPFDKQIGDYQVDVREGLVRLCNKPDDYHDPLKMGCCISGENSGTLGPFIMFENRQHNQYALTCAHVLLSKEYLKCVFETGIQEIRDTKKVYQPYITHTEDYFGEIVLAVHSTGTEQSAGMEIGLIHVQSRLPVMGNFPDADFSIAGFERQDQFVYTSNEVLREDTLDMSRSVFKYGSETLFTKGTFRTEGSSIRTIPVDKISHDMVLHGQIEVLSADGITFAKEGDSGALVMAFSSQGGQMAAVGILEGYFEDYSCYFVTPLADILKELESIKGTKCFLNKFVERKETDITFLAAKVDKIEENVEQWKQDHHEQLKQEFSNHTREINKRLQKLSDDQKEENTKINTQLKKQREEQKKENINRNNQFDQIMQFLTQRLPESSLDKPLPENNN